MFPMTAKTTMTEEAYRRFAWANFWYRKTGLFPLIIGEVALLAVGVVCLFFREPLPAIGIFIFMPIMPFLLYRSFNWFSFSPACILKSEIVLVSSSYCAFRSDR